MRNPWEEAGSHTTMIATVIVLTALLAPAAAAPDRSSASTLSTDNGNVKFSVGAGSYACGWEQYAFRSSIRSMLDAEGGAAGTRVLLL